jgi:peptide/nickel transport system substrate-binding protein
MKGNRYSVIITFLLTLVLILPGFFCINVTAESRLYVGFTKAESLNSLALNQDWHNRDMAQILWPLIYDQLWAIGPAPEYTPHPSLASSWETVDNQTWTFYLRPEARFRDGAPVTAEDVIFSLKYVPGINPVWDRRELQISAHTIIDDHTLEVTLAEPHGGNYPPFYRIPILPVHIWQRYQKKPGFYANIEAIGSGPYLLKDFKAGKVLRLIKNPDFWGKGARFDELFFLVFNNQKQLHNAMLAGIIDMFGVQGIDPLLIPKFESSQGIRNVISAGIDLHWLSFNLSKNSPLKNITIRKAMMLGIDKTKIIDQVFKGYAREIDSFIYPEQLEYNPNTTKYNFDFKKASRLLSKAGFQDFNSDGIRDDPVSSQDLTFSLLVSSDQPAHIAMGNLIKKQVRKLGISINLMKVDPFIYYSFLRNPVEGGFDIAINSAKPGLYNDWIWKVMKSDEDLYNEYNSSHYVNYAFDRIFDRMLTTSNLVRRPKYLFLMQEILSDDLPYGLLVRPYKICPTRESRIPAPISSMGGISSEINSWNYVYTEWEPDVAVDEPLF